MNWAKRQENLIFPNIKFLIKVHKLNTKFKLFVHLPECLSTHTFNNSIFKLKLSSLISKCNTFYHFTSQWTAISSQWAKSEYQEWSLPLSPLVITHMHLSQQRGFLVESIHFSCSYPLVVQMSISHYLCNWFPHIHVICSPDYSQNGTFKTPGYSHHPTISMASQSS